MAMHPIRALDHVINEYSDYLRTEFRAKDPALRAALERELDAPGFLAQEPFYQAHRPFKSGKRWRDLPIDVKLATCQPSMTTKSMVEPVSPHRLVVGVGRHQHRSRSGPCWTGRWIQDRSFSALTPMTMP